MSIRQGNRVVSGNNAVLKANKSLDNITTKAEEKIVNSVINTVGANEKGLIVNSSMFDMKITDRILSGSELAGWAIAGSTVYKSEYPDFYNACLKEYEGGFNTEEYYKVSNSTTLNGSVVENRGVLTNFSSTNYATLSYTIPSTITSLEMVGKVTFPKKPITSMGTLYGQSSKNNSNPQVSISATCGFAAYVSSTGSSWDIMSNESSVKDFSGKTVYAKLSWDGTQCNLYYSFNGHDWILDVSKETTTAPYWTENHKMGVDQSPATNISSADIKVHLKDCYIKINGEIAWRGSEVLPTKTYDNGHVYYDASSQEVIAGMNYLYNLYNDVDIYGIDTEHECIILPRPLEDENRFTYYCVGNTEVSSANIDISKEIELNNPFFLGMSKYFENTPTNASWLVSNGEFQSSAVYPAMYNYVLENVTAGTKDFARVNDTYDDYCFVLDEANQSFRLPLLNGEESIPSNRGMDLKSQMVKDTTTLFTAPGNGQYTFGVYATAVGQQINVHNASSDRGMTVQAGKSSGLLKVTIEAKRGDEVGLSYGLGGTINNGVFRYNKGNGTLYYYVGEAVNNANLIDTAKITTALANKVSKGSDEFDGDWIYAPKSIFSGVSFTTLNTKYTYDISEHLPNDDYDYEVQIYIYGSTAATSSKTTYLWCGTDATGDTNYPIVRAVTRTSSAMTFVGTAVLRVGAGRTFMLQNTGTSCGSCSGSLLCYRRLGRKN